MKKLAVVLGLFFSCALWGQQSKLGKPQFKLAGIDSGTVNVTTILADKKVRANNLSLKIVSFEMYIVGLKTETIMEEIHADSLSVLMIGALLRIKENQLVKILIENVKAINSKGETTYFRTPLKIKVKK